MEILITNDDGWGAKGILTLVRILTQLGHVTVVACCPLVVRRVAPRGIVGSHDMTVDACPRVVTNKIGMCAKQVHEQCPKTHEDTCQHQKRHLQPEGNGMYKVFQFLQHISLKEFRLQR